MLHDRNRYSNFTIALIYIVSGVLLLYIMVMLFTWVGDIRSSIAFADERVVAYNSSAYCALAEITIGYIIVSALVVHCAFMYQNFGRATYRKNKIKRRRKSNSKAVKTLRNRRLIRLVWGGVLLALIICSACFGFVGRECLHEDGSIHIYNSGNKETAVYLPEDIERLELFTYKTRSGKYNYRWTYSIGLYFEEERFRFEHSVFEYDGMGNVDEALYGMEQMKIIYADVPLKISGAENIGYVAEELGMNKQQSARLFALFDTE